MFYLRTKTRAALKGHWQTALLIALVVNLPSLLSQGIAAYTGNDPLSWLSALMVKASRDGVLSESMLLGEARAFVQSTGFWVTRGLDAAAWLVTPCLTLGMYKWMLDRVRGLEEPVGTVFCRVRLFFKAIGLQLLIILKILLWALPGICLTGLCLYLLVRANAGFSLPAGTGVGFSILEPVLLMVALPLMFVPPVFAALRCALAEYRLADRPETRVTDCLRVSRDLMKRHLRPLFLLMLFAVLWQMTVLYLAMLFSGTGSAGVLSLVFQMLAGLVQAAYLGCAVSAFYLDLAEAGPDAPAADPGEAGPNQTDEAE